MGKTTKFHPVSLHVIRGAAEYCGFRFEKVHQLHSFPEKNSARYNVTIVEFPQGWNRLPLDLMQSALQDCFLDDIRVHWLRKNRHDQWMCHLQVGLIPESAGGGGGGGPDADWDGLHVCSICGDRYTTGDICHVCQAQIEIDKDPRPQTYWCHQCGQYQARWEGALCLTCWLESRKPAGGGGGGGGITLDYGPDEYQDDGNCHNEDCRHCGQAILDEDVSRSDFEGSCYHDRCWMDMLDAAEEADMQAWLDETGD